MADSPDQPREPWTEPDPTTLREAHGRATAPMGEADERGTAPRGPALGTVLAWLAIFAMVVLVAIGQSIRQPGGEAEGEESPVAAGLFELQAKLIMGMADDATDEERRAAYRQIESTGRGSIRQRQRLVVVAFELAGLDEAERLLEDLSRDLEEAEPGDTATDRSVQDVLEAIYGHDSADAADAAAIETAVAALHPDDRQTLREHLGWFGSLALVPRGDRFAAERRQFLQPLMRMALAMVVAFLVLGGAGVIGLVGMVFWAGLAFTGRLRGGIGPPSSWSGIYAETFAIWMILFVALQGALLLAAAAVAPQSTLFAAYIGFVLSLGALAWPRLRGVPWSAVRADIGLTAGRRPLLEPLAGVACYAMTLPLILVGLLAVLLLMAIMSALSGSAEDYQPPTHPIITSLEAGEWWAIVQLYLVACLAAPVVEEIAFRGLLYRHLRDASRGRGAAGSIALSTLANTFIFAVIHPQGLLGVPALMAIATGLTLAREWRGTLVPSMTMHALSNGILLTLLVLVMAA